MLQVFLSWCWIGVSAFLWGYAGIFMIKRKKESYDKKLDLVMLCGGCLLTVFAELWSLCYKVGALANIFIIFVNIILIIVFRRKLLDDLKCCLINRSNVYMYVSITLLIMLLSIITSGNIYHYDTNLYHAQSIHWIEEYGIVPGLGNLHNRLAYNSSFFCLQALFSFKFLNGESLHSMNGFCVFIFLSYAFCTLKIVNKKRLYPSDFLRIGMIYLFCCRENIMSISSSGSDLLALGLVFYVFIKWVSYLEDEVKDIEEYAVLCLLSVYAISVKLSAAMLVLLTIMPVIKLIKQKDGKVIIKYIGLGIGVILPFLIRNVIISGYLIYPYPEVDLFSVDWKMPSYTLYYDRYEIQAWGRGLNDVFRFDATMGEWLWAWITKLSLGMRFFFFTTLVTGCYGTIRGLYLGLKSGKWDYLLVVIAASACFFMWFIGSPLARYGSAFLLIVPLYVIGELVCKYLKRIKKYIALGILIVVCGNLLTMIEFTYDQHNYNFIESSEYEDIECKVQFVGEQKIYVPITGDWTGYYDFPSTPYEARLNIIELRGDDLKDGFCIKKEYANKNISTYGGIYEDNVFDKNDN